MIKQILISCDLTRVKMQNDSVTSFHSVRVKKYYDLLSWQISQGTGLPVKLLQCSNSGFSLENFYRLANVPLKDEKSWVSIYDINYISEELKQYYRSMIEESLVVYIEMSETQKKLHNMLRIPYIDISVHPVRFMSDHYFLMSTNDSNLFNRLKEHELDERQFYIGARLLKVQIDQKPCRVENNSVLLIGQTSLDRSLMKKNKLYSLNDYIKDIEKLSASAAVVYFKPHPYVKDDTLYSALRDIPNLRFISSNTYEMLASEGITKVFGISSSVLYEAKYFEKESLFFNKKFEMFNNEFSENNYVSIGYDIFQPRFWEYVVYGTKNSKEINLSLDSNWIRASLDDFWSYTEFDPIVRVVSRSGLFVLRQHKNNKRYFGIKKIDDFIHRIYSR